MIEKNTIQKVLDAFFVQPSAKFHLRELSRLLNLSMPTIISATDGLAKKGLILKIKSRVVTQVNANRENPIFTYNKRIDNIDRVYGSGILEYLSATYNHPKLITLFGSYSRGEDIEESDVDIAIVTTRRLHLDLSKYEKKLNRKVSIHEFSLENLGNDFKANLANGIVLEGSW
ncbi:TPA: nucleotidyltransferase domain-containing protein [Candidatus Woesearchaeota archaeon]|nr:nucleotidyltransferase domain-containing protein [Candidatus Woesearchaeota archaeon]